MSPTGAYSGNSFAVPVSIVKKVVEDIIEFGEVQRAVLGVQYPGPGLRTGKEQNILTGLREYMLPEYWKAGAAKDAGIREGDVILRIDDVPG
jgi:serine protease Do